MKWVVIVAWMLMATSASAMTAEQLEGFCRSYDVDDEDAVGVTFVAQGYCTGYIAGLLDASDFLRETSDRWNICASPAFTPGLGREAFRQYLGNNPDEASTSAQLVFFSALLELYPCPD